MLDKTKQDTYNTRQKSLKVLGFNSYEEFLESSLWFNLKKRAVASGKNCYNHCYICKTTTDLEFHHLSYKHLDTLRNVRCVCRSCHEQAHLKSKLDNSSVRLASRRLRKNSQV